VLTPGPIIVKPFSQEIRKEKETQNSKQDEYFYKDDQPEALPDRHAPEAIIIEQPYAL
jgi:hypothetical protein